MRLIHIHDDLIVQMAYLESHQTFPGENIA